MYADRLKEIIYYPVFLRLIKLSPITVIVQTLHVTILKKCFGSNNADQLIYLFADILHDYAGMAPGFFSLGPWTRMSGQIGVPKSW